VLTVPLILAFLAVFGLGALLVMWAVDRDFPMGGDQ
jgi:uncharacterized integral membrane protein